MPLASCRRCKKLYQKVRADFCPACETAEENDFETVRQYLTENPDRNASEVSDNTGVPVETVLRFIAAGRLEAQGITSKARCGRCGAPAISLTKRLCERCLDQLNKEIAQQQSRIKLPEKKEAKVGNSLSTYNAVVDRATEKRA